MKIIYLIGSPGAGKTTLTQAFRSQWQILETPKDPVKHQIHQTPQGKALSLGWDSQFFGGTDTLGNTAIIPIEEWLPKAAESNLAYLYGEGDRLANARFLNFARNLGDLYLFYLDTDPEEAAERRRKRSELTGKLQNPSWVKGRATKHRNLALNFGAYRLPGENSPEQNANLMWDVVLS